MALKVGPHASLNPTGLGVWLSARPTVAVYQGSFYADAAPGCLIVGRPGNTDYLTPSLGNPVAVAGAWYRERVRPTAQANPHIKTWIAANEPDWKDREWSASQKAAAMTWYGQFDYALGQLAAADGLRLVLGNPAVGCWETEYLRYWSDGMRACSQWGHLYGGHYYGPHDRWHAFKFIEDLTAFAAAGYPDIRIVGTEGGAEKVAAGGTPWRTMYGSPERYIAEWVRPFEVEARKHPGFLGLALFTLGDPGGWHDYDVAGYDFPAAMVRLSNELGAIPEVPVPIVPTVPTEAPLFSFAGGGVRIPLYTTSAMTTLKTTIAAATWAVDVFEVRGTAWRVTKGSAGLWMRAIPLRAA